jgi:hypothetical protein
MRTCDNNHLAKMIDKIIAKENTKKTLSLSAERLVVKSYFRPSQGSKLTFPSISCSP